MGGKVGSPNAMVVSCRMGAVRVARSWAADSAPLEDRRHPLSEPNAQRGEANLGASRLHRVNERHDDASAARSHRMTERDGSTQHVDARRIEIETAFASD